MLVLTITSWNLTFSFSSLAYISVGIASSAIGTKSCKMTTRIKKYKSIIKKYNKKDDKIVLLEKKLDTIEVLISEALIDSFFSHDEFVSVDHVLREYNKKKEETKNHEIPVEHTI